MKTNNLPEFAALCHKVIISKLDIKYVDEIQSFCSACEGHVAEENVRNDKNLNEFSRVYFETATEREEQVLSDFLSTNPLFVFKEFAFDMVNMKKRAPKTGASE